MAIPPEYIPERGEIIWALLEPPQGEWRVGRSLALVLSPRAYNESTGRLLLCPVANQGKGGPYETPLPGGLSVQGVVLADRLRSLDWREAAAQRAGTAPASVVEQVLQRLRALLE